MPTPLSRETAQTVFIVDDDECVRSSMRCLMRSVQLEAEVFASGREFLELYVPGRTGCLVVDMHMPQLSGLDVIAELKRREATLPVIVITGQADVSLAVQALLHGALDILEKPVHSQKLIDQVHRALARDRNARNTRRVCEATQLRITALTERERQVLALLTNGHTNKAMAYLTGLSSRTIEIHRANLMRKMAVRTLVELVRAAVPFETLRVPSPAARLAFTESRSST